MKPKELAEKYFGEHKLAGSEVRPKYCPFCGGGKSHDTYTFSMHVDTGAYNCKRGSCSVSGAYVQLMKHYGMDVSRAFELQKPAPKTYTPPKVTAAHVSNKVEKYLAGRGFSKKTIDYWGLKESGGNILFPYYENQKLVMVKYRKPHDNHGDGRKAWREKGGKDVLWGMDKCDPQKMLIITEGEYDAMAVTEAGIDNVVSVSGGADDFNCIENCWEWLGQFKAVYIWPDNDQPGQEMCRKLISKLGAYRCYVVNSEEKDANETLLKRGKEQIWEYLENAQEVPIAGLIRLADVKPFEFKDLGRVRSSISGVNQVVGGYMYGMLSVWTGVNSSGKSTMLGQELVDAVDQGYRVCAYSGELPAYIYRYWIDLQAAGPLNLIGEYDDYKEANVMRVRSDCREAIREWYKDMFFLYDSLGGVSDKDLFEVFDYTARRYGCKIFLVDNLMLMTFAESDKDFYMRQSAFVKKLKKFALQHDCHVHLVAHPRKTSGRLTKMDVMGSGDITNIADNVLSQHRVPTPEIEAEGCHAYLDIFKNRFSGRQDVSVALLFDEPSKRFYREQEPRLRIKAYGWERRAK